MFAEYIRACPRYARSKSDIRRIHPRLARSDSDRFGIPFAETRHVSSRSLAPRVQLLFRERLEKRRRHLAA